MSAWRKAVLAALAAGAVAGCTEKLTAPGQCPALCPTSNVQLADTLLTLADTADTSVRGFVLVREASYLLAANEDTLKALTLIRFSALDTVWYSTTKPVDTFYVGRMDSVKLSLHIGQRDTSVKNLKLLVYRLPARFDTAATYASILPYFADSTLVDTVPIADTASNGGDLELKIADSLLIPPGDSGVVSLGLALASDSGTMLTLESGNLNTFTSAPTLQYYVHAKAPFDTLANEFSYQPFVATFVTNPPPAQPAPGVLAVGGLPTARSTIYLSLPKIVTDSTSVVRASLILNTVGAVGGFARDSFYVIAQPVVRDYGVKSILYPDSTVSGSVRLHQGQTGAVSIDVEPILRFWGTTVGDSTPRLIVLRVYPEGSILGSAAFAGRAAGALAPQLKVTYVKPYAFGVP